ncbi:MAG: DUF6754 domain-containing protein [Candidatus Bathyarchaeia archaeon]
MTNLIKSKISMLSAIIALSILLISLLSWFLKFELYSTRAPVSAFIILLTLLLSGSIFMEQAKNGKNFPVRKIRAFEAIEEAVARSVEMGRPVHATFGFGSMSSTMGPMYVAGLGVLKHVANVCAKYGAKLIVTHGVPEATAITEELVRESYYSGGRPELYDSINVRYLTDVQFAYASAVQATLVRENVGANIVVGPFWAETRIFMVTGDRIGAMQVAGTAREVQIPFFVLLADYAFIGEEIYAAGALASGDAVTLASLRGQDVGKLISIVLIIIGTILLMGGINMRAALDWVWRFG